MDVVWTDLHRRHAPRHEINMGQAIPTYERPDRAETIRDELLTDSRYRFVDRREFGREPVEAVHHAGLIGFLESAWSELNTSTGRDEFFPEVVMHAGLRDGMGKAPLPQSAVTGFGYWCYETATPLVEGTYVAARASVDVALTAADIVLAGASYSYGLCRPPGHHAASDVYGGFCFFNNAAIVAHHVATTTGSKVTVLDVDYHHGNGTQQIFFDRDDVQFVSLHGDPVRAYPWYTGHADEIGTGVGRGTTLNFPLAAETPDDVYERRLADACVAIADFAPSLLVVSLGVDTYWNDPISDFALTTDGYRRCGAIVRQLGLPTVVLQEGGYDIEAIGRNVHAWLDGLAGH
jgi:acetoin utilization deacetylase AcuC-like enzyme